MPSARLAPLLFGVLALAMTGCKDDDPIRSYQVPKVRQSPPRLLAAMVPLPDKIWFFKLAGPAPAVTAEQPAFEKFVASLRFSDKTTEPVTWTLPDGWRDSGGKTQHRHTTIRVGPEALDLSVTPLGPEAGDLRGNVNRWRGQIGLKPVAEGPELDALCRKITVDGKDVTLIDMLGVAPNAAPPVASEKPPVARPLASPKKPLSYDVPPGWVEMPPKSMRVAAFQVSEGGQSAEITVIPLGGAAGGLLANVNRWRKEVGLDDTTDERLAKESKSLDISGEKATYVDLAGKDERTIGVITLRGGQSWFFKFRGPSALVGKQQANFDAFIRSVRFSEGGRP